MFQLEGRTAIVTGASRGIGEAIAQGFARVGANLVLVSRNLSALEEAASKIESLGSKVFPISADIGTPEHIQKVVESSLRELGYNEVLQPIE